MKTYLLIAFVCCAIALVITYLLTHPARPLPAPPKAPEPAPAPLPDLPISCFVKGLIVSLEKEPATWGYEPAPPMEMSSRGWSSSCSRHRYLKGSVVLVLGESSFNRTGGCTYWSSIQAPPTLLNRTEEAALTKALIAVYEAQIAAEHAKQEAEAAVVRAPFEALGCPDEPRAK